MWHYFVSYVMKDHETKSIAYGSCEVLNDTEITNMQAVLDIQDELSKKYDGDAVQRGGGSG